LVVGDGQGKGAHPSKGEKRKILPSEIESRNMDKSGKKGGCGKN